MLGIGRELLVFSSSFAVSVTVMTPGSGIERSQIISRISIGKDEN